MIRNALWDDKMCDTTIFDSVPFSFVSHLFITVLDLLLSSQLSDDCQLLIHHL